MTEWIKVTENLPSYYKYVFVYDLWTKTRKIAYMTHHDYWETDPSHDDLGVSHWMEIDWPEEPELTDEYLKEWYDD